MTAEPAQPKSNRLARTSIVFFGTIAVVLLFHALGIHLSDWAPRLIPESATPNQRLLHQAGFLLATIWGWRAAILIHEAGHALTGWKRGFEFCCIVTGRYLIHRPDGSLRIRRQREFAFLGGFYMPAPKPDASRNDLLWLLAGGPIASAALALFGLGIAWYMGPQSGHVGAVARMALGVTGAISALLFASSAFTPAPPSGLVQDGARIRMLWNDDVAVASELAALRLAGFKGRGVRPRDWSPEVIEQVDAKGTARLRWVRKNAEVAVSLDRGEAAQALSQSKELMEEAESMTLLERKGYALPHSLLLAYVEGDGPNARKWLELSRGGFVQSHALLRAEAAVLNAEGATEEALSTVEKARTAWADALFPVTDGDRDLVAAVEAEIRSSEELSARAT